VEQLATLLLQDWAFKAHTLDALPVH